MGQVRIVHIMRHVRSINRSGLGRVEPDLDLDLTHVTNIHSILKYAGNFL